jgi:phosphoribosylamine--glycine ligase
MPQILSAIVEENIDRAEIRWSKESCVGIVMTSNGYPGKYNTGYKIIGLENLSKEEIIFHGGTKKFSISNQDLFTNGGRVLTVVGKAESMELARVRAYTNVANIEFEGASYRSDIALNI